MPRFKLVQWETQWLKLGVAGDTGTGKTLSSVLLGEGILSVMGGLMCLLDMDARRAAEYHDHGFFVEHMEPPYSSERISKAIKDAVDEGFTVMILDGMEREHQHMLDTQFAIQTAKHQEGVERARRDRKREPSLEAYGRVAWGKVKPSRKGLVSTIETAPIHLILTIAAVEKQNDKFKPRGWIPNTGPAILKPLKWQALLKPGAEGRPSWRPDTPDERDVVKNPKYLQPAPSVITRETGAQFAKWARGDHLREDATPSPASQPLDISDFLHGLEHAGTEKGLEAVDNAIRGVGDQLTPEQVSVLQNAYKAATQLLQLRQGTS